MWAPLNTRLAEPVDAQCRSGAHGRGPFSIHLQRHETAGRKAGLEWPGGRCQLVVDLQRRTISQQEPEGQDQHARYRFAATAERDRQQALLVLVGNLLLESLATHYLVVDAAANGPVAMRLGQAGRPAGQGRRPERRQGRQAGGSEEGGAEDGLGHGDVLALVRGTGLLITNVFLDPGQRLNATSACRA